MEPCGIWDNFTEFASRAVPIINLENNPMHSRDVLANTGLFQRRIRRGLPPGGSGQVNNRNQPYAFIAPFTASAVIGRGRTRGPQAVERGLPVAGGITHP